jgi:hypothetical protein
MSWVCMCIVDMLCVLWWVLPRRGSRVVVAMDWRVALHRQTAVDGLILRMRCEHPIVSGVRVRLVVVDLDLLRSHALHCDVGCFLEGNGIQYWKVCW